MKYYFAPLEGITGYVYRCVHHKFYPGIDRYYAPFIVPKEKKYLNIKERNDILPRHNKGLCVIPQIMTNNAKDFLRIACVLKDEYGYGEINLNLGCPSKTVVSKKRGAGFLSVPERLDMFLEEVCNGLESKDIRLSVKTRIGKDAPEEFAHLLEIYLKYPLSQLIVHPRIQADFYDNVPNIDAFLQAYKISIGKEWELCYNGDIFKVQDNMKICRKFPGISAVMIGRGLLRNPMLVEEIKIRENSGTLNHQISCSSSRRFLDPKEEKEERKRRYELYLELQNDYMQVLSAEKDVLFKMKELWMYMCQDFTEPQRYWKKMKKAQKLADFELAVSALCREQLLIDII